MSGRGITAESIRRNTPQGLYTRLQSHASGRRSADQFFVYVADRLVLPNLRQEDIADIASGRHQMDAFVRQYIHENLSYRFVMLPDGARLTAGSALLRCFRDHPLQGTHLPPLRNDLLFVFGGAQPLGLQGLGHWC
jgi:hypothetical protein